MAWNTSIYIRHVEREMTSIWICLATFSVYTRWDVCRKLCGPLWASPLQFLSVESWQVEARWPQEKRQDHTHSQCAGQVVFTVKGVSLGSWQVQTHHKASMQAFGFSQWFLLLQHSGTQQTVPPAAVSATAQCCTREHICISFPAYYVYH